MASPLAVDIPGSSPYIRGMKNILFLTLVVGLIIACSDKKNSNSADRLISDFDNANKIGTIRQLTDDYRSIYPVFGPGDTIVFYQRLLLADVQDTFAYYPEERIKPYGLHISTGELYTLSQASEFPPAMLIDPAKLPNNFGKEPVFAVASPDSMSYAFETIEGTNKVHVIYLVEGDSIRQLTHGSVSCFLERFSSTGRYISAIYGKVPTWILIFDLIDGGAYRIPNDSGYVDYLTTFSTDDRMMMFVRSNNLYRFGSDFFGNITLFEFNNKIRSGDS
jgi:hypothetical protein